jgi:XTP/dITP diphosphohydrolase
MTFVIATNNFGKLREIRQILDELNVDAIPLKEAGIEVEVEETGTTFYENALLKANSVYMLTGKPAIADDSGLIVEALGGEPGVNSRYYGGGDLDDEGLCKYLLKNMENMELRAAKFVCNIVAVFPDGCILSAVGECEGKISHKPIGNNGFGYDPVFIPNGKNTTLAQLTTEEKNSISHRGAALREFSRILSDRMSELC